MAKKRGEKRPAPPQPPPSAASSEETHSGADESEDEETIAVSRTPAPKNPPPPPQKGEESETSDEEEEEEEEPSHAAPTTAPKKHPPAARQSEDSDSSDEEDGGSESDKDAPPPKPSPKQEAKAPDAKKPRLAFHRVWSTNDEVRILEALAAHQKEHGVLPQPDALVEALAGKLDNRAYSSKELQGKVKSLKHRYVSAAKKYELPSKEHDRRVLDLSKTVWGSDKSTAAAASVKAPANDHKRKRFEEMCELFPYLAEVVKELMVENPGMFKREFGKMDDEKARVMDEKIKRQRVAQMKVGLRRHDLTREVTKAIINLVH